MALRILRERLESFQITCLSNFPKNATHSFVLDFIIINRTDSHYTDDIAYVSTVALPERVQNAKEVYLSMHESSDRLLISVYTKK